MQQKTKIYQNLPALVRFMKFKPELHFINYFDWLPIKTFNPSEFYGTK